MGGIEADAARLRRHQFGVITVAQLVELGTPRSTVYRRIREGRYVVVCKGVVADAGSVLSPQGLLKARLLAGGPDVIAGGCSSLALHELCPHPSSPDLLAFASRRVRIDGQAVPRRRRLTARDLTWRADMRCLKVDSALIEASAVMERDPFADVLDRALALRRAHPERLVDLAVRLRRPHAPGPDIVLGLLENRLHCHPTESALEDRFLRVTATLGVRWEMQVLLRDASGERVVRADFTCTDQPDLVVECDSYRWHSGKRAFERDTRRRTRLAAESRAPLVFTWHDIVRDPVYVLEMIVRKLAAVQASLG